MFSAIRSVHFIGIGGTAMASAAAAMQEKGFRVTDSDQNVYPPMSAFLAERQIEVMNGYANQSQAPHFNGKNTTRFASSPGSQTFASSSRSSIVRRTVMFC